MNLNRREADLIIGALKGEQRLIHNMMADLTRRGFSNGDQQVSMQNRMHELNDLIIKVEGDSLRALSL